MNDKFVCKAICHVGRLLYERGYMHATAGNINTREPTPPHHAQSVESRATFCCAW